MRKSVITIFILLVITVCCTSLYAQKDNCEEVLNRATEEFNAGHFYHVPSMLKPCIDGGFSREQRQRAYLLLTQIYLLLDDPIGAEDSYLKVLKSNPEFVALPGREPIDLVYLSKKFTAAPVLSYFGKIGGNISPVRVIHDWNISDDYQSKRYTLSPGWQAGVGLDWNVKRTVSLSFEVNYTFSAYKKEMNSVLGNDVLEAFDRQNWFNVPLSLKYTFDPILNVKPYAYAGVSANLLMGDKMRLLIRDRDRTIEGDLSELEEESPDLNFTMRRKTFNRSFFVGGGFQYKYGLDYFFADVRYSFGLNNIVDPAGRFGYGSDYTDVSAAEAVFRFAHVDDDMRLDHLTISVGYIRPIYKPRKLKKAKTGSVLRSIKKQKG